MPTTPETPSASQRAGSAAANVGSCQSCGHPLAGAFCPQCGEERFDLHKLTVWHFLTQSLLPEITDLDGKIWRSLRFLLFRPAFLALEFAAGRRRPYVKPLRILITAIIVYALGTQSGNNVTLRIGTVVLSLAPNSMPLERSVEGTLMQIDRYGILERMFRERVGPIETVAEDAKRRFNGTLNAFATALSFTSVVLLALAFYACFHRRRPLLVEHAVFGMHYFSFVLLSTVLLVALLALRITGVAFAIAAIFGMTIWQFAYLTAAVRRFYWSADPRKLVPWTAATGVALLMYALNALFITSVQLVAGAIAIARL